MAAGVLTSSMAFLLWPATALAADPAARDLGRRLFVGEAMVRGTITGHQNALPALASRCVNCHSASAAARDTAAASAVSATASATTTSSFAPALTRQHLTGLIARRGGPPSRYDEASFCRLLRTGIDPAYVLIPRNMPRYELPDADCHALWAYLNEASDR